MQQEFQTFSAHLYLDQLHRLFYPELGEFTDQYVPVYTLHNLQLLGKNQKQYHAKCMLFARMQLVSNFYTMVFV